MRTPSKPRKVSAPVNIPMKSGLGASNIALLEQYGQLNSRRLIRK
jgi:hypothetical protein